MKIGGWNIASAGAYQWNVTPGTHTLKNNSEWLRGSPVPVMSGNYMGFKTLKVALMVTGDGRENILNRCSTVISHLTEPAEIELDGFTHRFYGILSKHSLTENPLKIPDVWKNRAAKLTLEFDGYEFAAAKKGKPYTASASCKRNLVFKNQGNILTPAVIEITPQAGAASLLLTGICRDVSTMEDLPVTVGNLTAGQTVILDGETGLFTENGEIKPDLEIWGRPALLPGVNTVTADNDWMDITIKYYPRYI